MTETLRYGGTLVVSTCWCGMRHAVPQELRDFQERQHDNGEQQTAIYCPLGHTYIHAGKGEAERLRERLERERARITALSDQHEAEKRSHAATKGQLTKARKRIGNGTCPECHRHFTNVERHMASKHPEVKHG